MKDQALQKNKTSQTSLETQNLEQRWVNTINHCIALVGDPRKPADIVPPVTEFIANRMGKWNPEQVSEAFELCASCDLDEWMPIWAKRVYFTPMIIGQIMKAYEQYLKAFRKISYNSLEDKLN